MWFSKNKSVLGIDIGTSAIKMVQLNHDGNLLETYGIVDLPEPITAQSKPEQIAGVVELLGNLVTKANTTTKKCSMSLPNSAVFTSVIDLPRMSDQELDQAINFEAKKYVPLPLSEVSLSWTLISENTAESMMKILLIAVPKQIRDIYVQIFQSAGLELKAIETESLALIRTLVQDKTKNDVIIDIGAKVTGINFIREGLLYLTRSMNIGGETITEKIAHTLNLNNDRAEQFKKDFGLNGTDFLPEAVKPVLSSIKNEVKQLLNLYKSHDIEVHRIVLTGGGALMPGLKEYFADLGIETVYGDVLGSISYPDNIEPVLKRFSMQLPVAIGLAMRDE